jgi:hypothetical protein
MVSRVRWYYTVPWFKSPGDSHSLISMVVEMRSRVEYFKRLADKRSLSRGPHVGIRAVRFVLLVASAILASSATSRAGTYYIDYVGGADANNGTSKSTSWKHAPGMTGCTGICSSITLVNGDIVVFKGGVTWTSSFPWTFQGGSSSTITYTTDHAWFGGASYSEPVFDDQAAHPGATGMGNASGVGFITINELKWVNCGSPQTANSDKCLVFTNTHDISLTNSTFLTESWISVYFVFSSPGSYSNFTFTGNDFSRTSGAIWFASAQPNTSMHNVTYNSNTFHDYSSQIGGGVHGDGAWHYFSVPSSDSTQYLDGVTFCNNHFYGDFRNSFAGGGAMTGFFFAEGSLSGTICNNDMSFSPVQANMFDGLIVLDGYNNVHPMAVGIYNNSLANIGANAMSAGIHTSGGFNNITVKNNIVSGMTYPVYVEDGNPTFVSDFNVYDGTSGQLVFGPSFQGYSQWQAAGRDTNSKLGVDPLWVAAPGNEQLSSNSPAISAASNLTSIPALASDISGFPRPNSGAWDAGAFKFQSSAGPNPPTALTATVH